MAITQDRLITLVDALDDLKELLKSIRRDCEHERNQVSSLSQRQRDMFEFAKQSGSIRIVQSALIEALEVIENLTARQNQILDRTMLRAEFPEKAIIAYIRESEHFKLVRKKNDKAREYQEKLRRRHGILTWDERSNRASARRDMAEILAAEDAEQAERIAKVYGSARSNGQDETGETLPTPAAEAEEIWPELDADGNVIRPEE